jgi:hypothetical protein
MVGAVGITLFDVRSTARCSCTKDPAAPGEGTEKLLALPPRYEAEDDPRIGAMFGVKYAP